MPIPKIEIPEIPLEEQNDLVWELADVIDLQQEVIESLQEQLQMMKDEIAILKGNNPKPVIRPSQLEVKKKSGKNRQGKRAGSSKRNKTKHLRIDHTEWVSHPQRQADWKFKGYRPYVVQDLQIRVQNTCYYLERWKTSEGQLVTSPLPPAFKGRHFAPALVQFILYQYHHAHVTQPLLLEELREWGVDISSGELNRLLGEDYLEFHEEKQAILEAGLQSSSYVQVDDTGARHQGKNGFCTAVGNGAFAFFKTSFSKSRLNFLDVLGYDEEIYRMTSKALEYMEQHGMPMMAMIALKKGVGRGWKNEETFTKYLRKLGMDTNPHLRIAREGAAYGSLIAHGISEDLIILSDDAGQFNLFNHALCWIHAERHLKKLIPSQTKHRNALKKCRKQFWKFYQKLKCYKREPSKEKQHQLEDEFIQLTSYKTGYPSLDSVLWNLSQNRKELLKVLEHPQIPLHNNESERDIREYVKRRKISGSTRSELGKQARDTFVSLKKTCRKLNLSYWRYLQDRLAQTNQIPPLAELVRQQSPKM